MRSVGFLRWAGSKQKLIPQLKEYWGNGHNRYIEPFMGSAKLFFSLDTEAAILSDTNKMLIETFTQVQKNPYAVYKVLKEFKVSREEYYRIRDLNPESLGINQRAARFIYLNRLCFNGLYRTNNSGKFNVPYSGENTLNLEEQINILREASKKLKSVKLICGDFEDVVKANVKKGDFVYLDPPYAVNNRRIFKQYGPQTFGIDDLKRLRNLLKLIESTGASFLLSYAYCKEATELFSNWSVKKTFTQRNISGFVEYRRKAAELLVSNIC